MTFLNTITYWHWMVLGITLITLEVFIPGAFMLWFGLAATVTGLLLLLIPDMHWQVQFLIFASFSVVSIFVVGLWLKRHAKQTENPHLNRRGEQYINQTFFLEEPIVNGQGKIRVDDTWWKIRGEDCSAGTRIIVERVEAATLVVKPA